jgi:hypothetical protein
MTKNFAANMKIGAIMGSSVGRVFGNVKKRLKDQEGELKRLRSAYKDASKGTGEYAGKLDQLQREIDQTESKLKRLRAASKFDWNKVGSTMAGDFKRLGIVAGVAGAAIGGISAAIGKVTIDFLAMADDLADVAESLNISVEALQLWEYAAADVGIEANRLRGGLARLQSGMESGSKNIEKVFGELHLNMSRVKKLKPEQQLEVIAEAFSRYEGQTSKAYMAAQLFGRSNVNLVSVLNKGKAGLEAYNEEAREAGFLLDEAAMAAAGKADVAYRRFGATMQGLRNQIALKFIPVFTRVIDVFRRLLTENAPRLQQWANSFALSIERNLVPSLVEFAGKLPGIIDQIGNMASKFWNILTAVKDFLGGWDNLGIALIALNFAPTIAAIGSMTAALWTLTGASWAAVGPWVALAAAIGGVYLAWTNLDKIMDWWDSVVPEKLAVMWGTAFIALEEFLTDTGRGVTKFFIGIIDGAKKAATEMKDAFVFVFTWMGQQFDLLGSKISAMWDKAKSLGDSVKNFFGFGSNEGKAGQIPVTPREAMPSSTSNATQNNNFNINVTAPGGDGRRIADELRSEFNRKPLYDMNSFAPAR